MVFTLLAGLLFADSALAATLSTNQAAPPPKYLLTVTGSGFGAQEAVDVFLDTTDMALAFTSGSGAFSVQFRIPAEAVPGSHYITALGRKSGRGKQKVITVRTDWLQFRFSAGHAGVNPYENVLSASTAPDLTETWLRRIGAGSTTRSSPVIYGGYLYITGGDGMLHSINSSTGAVKWSRLPVGGTFNVESAPAVAYASSTSYTGPVIIGAATSGLHARKSFNGNAFWSYATGSPSGYSPVVSGGKVYFGAGNRFYALRVNNGTLVWSSPIDLIGPICSNPVVARGKIYLTASDFASVHRIYAYDADTGAPIWDSGSTFSPISIASSNGVAVANGVLYYGSVGGTTGAELYAFNADTGLQLWNTGTTSSQDIGGAIHTAPAVYKGRVYVGAGDGYVYAFDAKSGEFKWRFNAGSSGGSFICSPVIANGVLYVGSSVGFVYALNYSSGSMLWAGHVGGRIDATPAVADGRLYTSSIDGLVHCYSLEPGAMLLRLGMDLTPPKRPHLGSLVPDYSLEPGMVSGGSGENQPISDYE